MLFYVCQNTKFSFPNNPWPSFCRSTGPVDRAWSRSTESVDRRAQPCTPALAGGPVDRVGRQPESFCSLESPDRPGRSTGRELCSLFQAAVDWAGRPKLQQSDFWPLAVDRAGRPTAVWAEKLPQQLVFVGVFIYPIWGLFWVRFLERKIPNLF